MIDPPHQTLPLGCCPLHFQCETPIVQTCRELRKQLKSWKSPTMNALGDAKAKGWQIAPGVGMAVGLIVGGVGANVGVIVQI